MRLYNLTQEQLSRTLMPVGDYTKDEIRAIAEKIGFTVAHKPDSQEICFVPDQDYAGFIDQTTGKKMPEGQFCHSGWKGHRQTQGYHPLYGRTAEKAWALLWGIRCLSARSARRPMKW